MLTIEQTLEQTEDISELITLALAHGKKIANKKTRTIPFLKVGQTVAQGDLYFTRVNKVPHDSKELKRPKKILGTSEDHSKGRHTIVSYKGVRVYRLARWRTNILHGYLLALDGESMEIDHPQHANLIFLKPSLLEYDEGYFIQVHYQREYGVEIRRTVD